MMLELNTQLPDDAARKTAMALLDKSLLVEAGAGSGKTAVMAGRVAMLLAQGVAPGAIAAVTFTELAAGELLARVREFTELLCSGTIPAEMRVALPEGLSPLQREHLLQALPVIDELSCSTIHGFCQQLVKPYPVEADMDPGATVMDGQQAQQVLDELVDQWLWSTLDGNEGGLLASLIAHDAASAVALVRALAGQLRQVNSSVAVDPAVVARAVTAFEQAGQRFQAFLQAAAVQEATAMAAVSCFTTMAQLLRDCAAADPDVQLVRQLVMQVPSTDLTTKTGNFATYRAKAKWEAAAKAAGLGKAVGEELSVLATDHYNACTQAWGQVKQQVAELVLARLTVALQPILHGFAQYKRSSALLDFDDLIHSARALLRDHEAVRVALGRRYQHVLVDEFQDTDPLQTEILWRLCGDPRPGSSTSSWLDYQIRPGALFLVGDPKQAIYRFRGADIAAYTQARQVFLHNDPASVLQISTNFRSLAAILSYANQRFAQRLSEPGQPGFIALDAFRNADAGLPSVFALDVAVDMAADPSKTTAARMAESETVAALCLQLLASHRVPDKRSGVMRACRPGDIALLAPMGTELWRYEAALERCGIPVASQAGKGFFRRQEIQDLIALTRVLADSTDLVAFGALLRGPLVGLSEEELLDIVWGLPRDEHRPEHLPRLTLNVDPMLVQHPLASDVITRLQALRKRRHETTPHLLLAEAIDVFHVRSILMQRLRGQAERALANVDQYLAHSRRYAAQGIGAFAAAMSASWEDAAKAVEGQTDAQEDAVTLFTVHAAKGLEWPVVVPVNMMTQTMPVSGAFVERESGRFHCSVLGVKPAGFEAARQQEADELARERIRLWYVALTRARDLLILPRLDSDAATGSWAALLDLALPELPAYALGEYLPLREIAGELVHGQSREQFSLDSRRIADGHLNLTWTTPSRGDGTSDIGRIMVMDESVLDAESSIRDQIEPVRGGVVRGLLIHKLLEEFLSGEVSNQQGLLEARVTELIAQLGKTAHGEASDGVSPREIAQCVATTVALPAIAPLLPSLHAEFCVYGGDGLVSASAGIADAISFTTDGLPDVVVDWKSDVAPSDAMQAHYRDQVSQYMNMTGARRGLIVFVTSGTVIELLASSPSAA